MIVPILLLAITLGITIEAERRDMNQKTTKEHYEEKKREHVPHPEMPGSLR